MRNIKISIIIPVFNIETFIGRCIESVLSQNFKDFELILIDDGSEDASLSICKNYREKDERIIIIENNHQGVGTARNIGLDIAKGEYIAFIDGDDLIHPDYLKCLYAAIKQLKTDIIISDYTRIKSDLKKIESIELNTFTAKEFFKYELYPNLFDDIKYMTIWGKLYRKNIIANQRFQNFSLGEDIEFNSRVFPHAKKICSMPFPLYFYRERPNSAVSSKFNLKNMDNITAYATAYYNIKGYMPEYSHFALIRLFKNILALTYNCTPELKQEIEDLKKSVVHNTIKDFLIEPKINPFLKLFFISSVKFPIIYKWFRDFMEWKNYKFHKKSII